jgi:F-type H+-transporting ATPase subunit delta
LKKIFGALPTRYARALFLVAKEGEVVGEVENDLQTLDATLTDHNELIAAILNPGLGKKQVRGVLNSLSSKLNFHPVTRKFIDLLLEKRRLELLSTIPAYYHKLFLEHQNQVEVKVTTAVVPDEALKSNIQAHLAKRSGKKPLITWLTRPEILGGLVVEWPESVFDGSLTRKLKELENRMVEAV